MAPDLQFGGVFCGNPETGIAEKVVRVVEVTTLFLKKT